MNMQMTVRENRELERDTGLARLADLANQAHGAALHAARDAVGRALEAGRALVEARRLCPKGIWTAWLASHFSGSSKTAHDYMRVATYVAEKGGDLQCVAGLNYSEVIRMLAGRSRSDGRANPHRRLTPKQMAPAALPSTAPPSQAQASAAPTATSQVVQAADGDPFQPIVQLLEQVVDHLRRLVHSKPGEAPYARHLLQLLEPIGGGVTTRTWFWDSIEQ